MFSGIIVTPAGNPSTIADNAGPCDSPDVKYLIIVLSSKMPGCFVIVQPGFLNQIFPFQKGLSKFFCSFFCIVGKDKIGASTFHAKQ